MIEHKKKKIAAIKERMDKNGGQLRQAPTKMDQPNQQEPKS